MKKKDEILSLICGFLISIFFILILKFNIRKNTFSNEKIYFFYFLIIILFTIFSYFWVKFFKIFAKNKKTIYQSGKFILVGSLNTVLDWGILTILMISFNIFSGFFYSIFKAISFLIAVFNSYFWNKFWIFESLNKKEIKKEFLKFLFVSLVGFLINVSVASTIVNLFNPPFNISTRIWAYIGAIFATISAMTWNFLSYKFFVFK